MLKQAIVLGLFAMSATTVALAGNTDTLTQIAATQVDSPVQVNYEANAATNSTEPLLQDESSSLVVNAMDQEPEGYADEALTNLSNTVLFDAVGEWLGTPYRYGGKSKRGTCCSGFVAALYDELYDLNLYGSSRDQWTRVKPVKKGQLKEGDLVFFNIRSRSISHVGVYLGSNKFAHASVSRGVIISYLSDSYWARYYFGGGRLREFSFENK